MAILILQSIINIWIFIKIDNRLKRLDYSVNGIDYYILKDLKKLDKIGSDTEDIKRYIK